MSRGPRVKRRGKLCSGAMAAALLAGCGLQLAGCGFHLEGHEPLPPVVKSPYVEAPDRQSDFVQYLRHDLLSNGAHLQQKRGDATAVVSILRDTVVRRTLSFSATNQPNQYELTYTVAFAVSAAGKELLPAQELSATRTFSFQEQLLLAKGHEEDILRQDMARDLAELVMRRLSSL